MAARDRSPRSRMERIATVRRPKPHHEKLRGAFSLVFKVAGVRIFAASLLDASHRWTPRLGPRDVVVFSGSWVMRVAERFQLRGWDYLSAFERCEFGVECGFRKGCWRDLEGIRRALGA